MPSASGAEAAASVSQHGPMPSLPATQRPSLLGRFSDLFPSCAPLSSAMAERSGSVWGQDTFLFTGASQNVVGNWGKHLERLAPVHSVQVQGKLQQALSG